MATVLIKALTQGRQIVQRWDHEGAEYFTVICPTPDGRRTMAANIGSSTGGRFRTAKVAEEAVEEWDDYLEEQA